MEEKQRHLEGFPDILINSCNFHGDMDKMFQTENKSRGNLICNDTLTKRFFNVFIGNFSSFPLKSELKFSLGAAMKM